MSFSKPLNALNLLLNLDFSHCFSRNWEFRNKKLTYSEVALARLDFLGQPGGLPNHLGRKNRCWQL